MFVVMWITSKGWMSRLDLEMQSSIQVLEIGLGNPGT